MQFFRFKLLELKLRPGLAYVLCALSALFLIAFRLWPQTPLAETLGTSRAVYARGGELLRLTLAPDQQYRLWTPLADKAPTLVDAVLAYED